MSKKIKLKKRAEKTKVPSDEFSLEAVLELGGDKADYALLLGIEDDNEVFGGNSEDLDADPIKKHDIRNFIKELGLSHNEDEEGTEGKSKKPKKVKLLTAPSLNNEEEDGKLKTIIQTEDPVPDSTDDTKTKKKKTKNKYKVQDDEISSTSVDENEVKTAISKSKTESVEYVDELGFINAGHTSRSYLLVKPGGKWFDTQNLEKIEDGRTASDKLITKLKAYTTSLMEDEVALFKKQQDNSKTSDAKWIRTVMKSGTLADKTAALTLMIQESPLHNLISLDSLVNMVKKKGHREALTALDTVKELWLSELLPDHRKLRKFEENPLIHIETLASGNKDTRDKRLLLWYFEDQLKEGFEVFLQALKTLTQDQLAASKKKSLDAIYQLLVKKPEQERKMLEVIVNKLGDPDSKVATHSAHRLSRLVEEHPNMKTVVCAEVERLLYRTNVSQKAQYFAVCFLNQLLLTRSDKKLAAKLISIYFSFFKVFTEKKKKVETKMLSALLTGVNRAFPYAKVDIRTLETELNNLYKTVHMSQFNTSVQALMLLFHVVDASDSVMCDRYYSALYRKLLDSELQTSSRQAMFLNLLFKSLKKDDSDNRIKAFVKRLLQQCCHMTPTFICGSLVLLSEILQLKPKLLDVVKINRQLQKQVELDQGTDGEDKADSASDSDEEEHFMDVKDDSDEDSDTDSENEAGSHEEEVKKALSDKGHTTAPTWVHRKNTGRDDRSHEYDPLYRNPMYCHADRECVWELRRLLAHYHPTVILFTDTLLKGNKIDYTGNPLLDFSLIRFLDRFVYRNPKKKEKQIGNALDPRSKALKLKGIRAMAVNDEKYLQLDETSIPVEERFFHKVSQIKHTPPPKWCILAVVSRRYFKQQALKKKDKSVADHDSDAESVDDEEFDSFLDNFEKTLDGGEQEMEFDFAGEVGKQGKGKITDYIGEDSDDDLGDLSDEEIDFGDEFKMADDMEGDEEDLDEWESGSEQEAGGDSEGDEPEMDFDEDEDIDDDDDDDDGQDPGFDEDDIAFSDDEDDMADMDFTKTGKKKTGKEAMMAKKNKLKSISSGGGLFAAAEEFADLIDENADSKIDLAGTEAMSNKDNAHVKQLRWESERDKWVQGKDWKSKNRNSGGKKINKSGGVGWKANSSGGGGSGWKANSSGGGSGWKANSSGGGGSGWKANSSGGGGSGWKANSSGGGSGWKANSSGGGGSGWKAKSSGKTLNKSAKQKVSQKRKAQGKSSNKGTKRRK